MKCHRHVFYHFHLVDKMQYSFRNYIRFCPLDGAGGKTVLMIIGKKCAPQPPLVAIMLYAVFSAFIYSNGRDYSLRTFDFTLFPLNKLTCRFDE